MQEPDHRAGIVYEVDTRKDIYQLDIRADQRIRADATGVLLMVPERALTQKGDKFVLRTKIYGEANVLCGGVKFWKQPSVAVTACSSFLVAPDIVATAAHCLRLIPWQEARYITGFAMTEEGVVPLEFTQAQVYRAVDLLWDSPPESVDGALLRLDRPVAAAQVAVIRLSDSVPKGAWVHTLGFGMGLPMKQSWGAEAGAADRKAFSADLTAFSGNSGGAVYNSNSYLVEGICRGAPVPGFVWDAALKCYRPRVVYDRDKKQVEALSASVFAPLVPGYSVLTSDDTGLALTIQDGSLADGAPLVQSVFADLLEQWFRLERLPAGWYRIVACHSGKVLGVSGDPLQDGAPIVQQSWTEAEHQQFRVERADDQYTVVRPRLRPSLSLDVKGGSKNIGAPVIQYPYANQRNQRWFAGTPIRNRATGFFADIEGGSRGPGAKIIQYEFQGGWNQIFQALPLGHGLYRIATNNGTGLSWTMWKWAPSDRVWHVLMMPWSTDTKQLFQLDPVGHGDVRILPVALPGITLEVGSAQGYAVVGVPFEFGNENQYWRIQATAPSSRTQARPGDEGDDLSRQG
jgi:hypothetical protein